MVIDMKLSALHFKTLLSQKKSSKGFTLIELLVVIGILAVLLAITLIAINPARQFEQANNTQRSSDVNAILNAVWQYAVDPDQGGSLVNLNLPTTPTEIGNGTGQIDLCPDVAPTYIAQLPVDPQEGSWGAVDTNGDGCPDNYNTGYTIMQSTGGRVTVSAPNTEPLDADATNDISVTR